MSRHLNLLPWKVRCHALWRGRLRQWCFLWGIIAVAAISATWWKWQRFAAGERELEIWQRRSEAIQIVESSNAGLQEKIKVLQARLNKYGHFENERNGFQLLATVNQSAGQCNGRLQVQKLSFKTSQVPEAALPNREPNAKPEPPKMRTVHVLSLSGVASTNLTLAQFVSALRDAAVFQTVELKSSQGKGEIASGPRSYQVECSF